MRAKSARLGIISVYCFVSWSCIKSRHKVSAIVTGRSERSLTQGLLDSSLHQHACTDLPCMQMATWLTSRVVLSVVPFLSTMTVPRTPCVCGGVVVFKIRGCKPERKFHMSPHLVPRYSRQCLLNTRLRRNQRLSTGRASCEKERGKYTP